MILRCLLLAALCWLAPFPATAQAPAISAIDRVWSAHPVQFGISADERLVVIAYYDAERQLTVASRSRAKEAAWRYQKLPSRTGWDSHNYLAVAIDRAGQIHVTGNMHNDPLVYFRTERAGDVRTLRPVPTLADAARERRMTYPVFLKTGDGRLVFKYRDGGSGNGNEIYNIYDEATGRWAPLLTTPLADGEGKRNAYFVGPVRGPDGRFHLTWVWRETPDAATNHDLSYAVSSDLRHWQRSDGAPIELPIRLGTSEIVDPVPVRGGIINNNTIIGFDSNGQAMIAYHKYDDAGRTQMFVARREAKGWRVAQASDWKDFRWDFGGGGSLDFRLSIESVGALANGQVRVRVRRDGVPSDLILDERTLARIGERQVEPDPRFAHIELPEGMHLNSVSAGDVAIAWATLPPNRDKPRADIPQPTTLYFIEQ
jgi:hypothetical protein